MSAKKRWNELFALRLEGEMREGELAELEALLQSSPEARALFHQACRIDGRLRREASRSSDEEPVVVTKVIPLRGRAVAWLGACAALLIGMAIIWGAATKPRIVADLVSSENASWQGNLPTAPGSQLGAGYLELNEGIATIRFRSGAELMLEAPAHLRLKSPMLARLESGAAVMNVPESAIGFVLETPDGHVVDHGTSFAVKVDEGSGQSDFEVIEGEISVHLSEGRDEVRLFEQQAASIVGRELRAYDGPLPEKDVAPAESVTRLGTQGRSISVIRANKEKWLHPDKLMVRRRNEPNNHERRAFFAFDLSAVDLDQVASVRLRLNQVPSHIGYATRLPKISKVGVYGMTNLAKADWAQDITWEEGPTPVDGTLLGQLDIPRSQQSGSRFFGGTALLDFLKTRAGESVSFILDGEVDPATGLLVGSMVIAFASDTHPEAPGPMLEFVMKDLTLGSLE